MRIVKIFLLTFILTSAIIFSQNISQELIDLGLSFIENPGDLFFNLQQDIEDCSPLLAGQNGLEKKYFAFRTNVLPTFLPSCLANIAIKGRLNTETKYIPQVGIVFGVGRWLVLNFVTSSDIKPQDKIIYYGLIFSKTFENTILYCGVKYSQFLLKFRLPETIDFYGSKLSEFNFNMNDTFLLTGIMLPVKRNKSVVAQMSYGLKYKKIVARVAAEHNHLQLGCDIFPEGLFVFHPYISYQWKF